jgi:HK97 gp10 family phage protein
MGGTVCGPALFHRGAIGPTARTSTAANRHGYPSGESPLHGWSSADVPEDQFRGAIVEDRTRLRIRHEGPIPPVTLHRAEIGAIMINTTVEAAELLAALQALSKTVAKGAIRRGSRAAAKVVQAEAKKLTPVITGQLARNIQVRALPRSRRYVGCTVKEQAPFAGFVEFGTKRSKGSHAIETAFENVKDQAQSVFIDTIKEQIEGMK